MVLLHDVYQYEASSISRQILREASNQGLSSTSEGVTISQQLSPQAIGALVAACFVGAMLFGLALDAVVKHINQPIASDVPREQIVAERSNRVTENQIPPGSTQSREIQTHPQSMARGLSNCIEHSGDWGRRALSITNGASSIGMSMYSDIEDGCVDYNAYNLKHLDLSDPSTEPS